MRWSCWVDWWSWGIGVCWERGEHGLYVHLGPFGAVVWVREQL